jgi:tetratricopeptide (TPR) repeat protein
VLALDDFHLAHADAASLVHFLVRSVSNAPILFVIMARPQLFDAHPEWLELSDSHAKRLDLAPLGVDDAAAMAEHLLSPLGEAAAELIDETAELAAGNPFLVEQIVRAYIDQGVVVPGVGNAPWSVNLELMNEVQLPLSVDDAIVARIAGLSAEEKSTLEMAASMGGVFWLGALVALERAAGTPPRLWLDPTRDRKRIAALLDELVDRDYLLRLPDASIPGETEYAFKHNLEREALHKYTSRQLLARHHRVIAQWLELHLGESSEEQHELLAQHYDLGAVPGRAGHHYLQAAERARMRFNWARAADYYRRALALLGEGEGLAKLRALEHFGEALEASGQRDHALSVFEQMRGLGYQLDIVPHVASAHAHIGRLHRDLGQLPQALEHLDTAQALYESAGDEHGSASCIAAVARVQVLKGNFDAAEHMFEDAVATFEKLGDKRALLRTLLRQTSLERERANMREAELLLDRALGIARELGDDASVADALTQLGVVRDRQQEPEAAINAWNEALAIAQRISDRSRQANALACLGASAYRDGAHAEALARLTQAATMAAALGNRLLEGDVLRSLAKARAFTGEVSGALEAAQRAIEIFEAAQARPQLGVALRSYADIVAAAGNPNGLEAIGLYEQARLVLAEAGCDVEQARASLALADLLGKGSAEAADGRERAVRAEGLRSHARQLLERHSEINLRTSLVLGAPSGASKVTRRA